MTGAQNDAVLNPPADSPEPIEALCRACCKTMHWQRGEELRRCLSENVEGETCDTLNYWPGGAR